MHVLENNKHMRGKASTSKKYTMPLCINKPLANIYCFKCS